MHFDDSRVLPLTYMQTTVEISTESYSMKAHITV
jgi:hypothetical protein